MAGCAGWHLVQELSLSLGFAHRSSPAPGTFPLVTVGAVSSCAEVIRTRLREEGTKYKTFIQTARLVAREEGYLAFYRGLFAQLIRQIPNTAIVLSTYELIVYLLEDHAK